MGFLDKLLGRDGIEPKEAFSLLKGGAVLVDVREPSEFSAGHAPKALSIPLGKVEEQVKSGKVSFSKDDKVLVICRSGGRSAIAVASLKGMGYDATNINGGMSSWQASGLDVVDASGNKGNVI